MTRTTATTALLVAAASLAALGLAAPAARAEQVAPAGAVVLTDAQMDTVTAGGTRTASSSGTRESTLLPDTGSVEFGGYQTEQVTISGVRVASSPGSREST